MTTARHRSALTGGTLAILAVLFVAVLVLVNFVFRGARLDLTNNNLVIRNSRIVDQIADGVNFHWGVTNSRVTNTFVRNTGDDGLAMWAQSVPNVANSFDHNTVAATAGAPASINA